MVASSFEVISDDFKHSLHALWRIDDAVVEPLVPVGSKRFFNQLINVR